MMALKSNNWIPKVNFTPSKTNPIRKTRTMPIENELKLYGKALKFSLSRLYCSVLMSKHSSRLASIIYWPNEQRKKRVNFVPKSENAQERIETRFDCTGLRAGPYWISIDPKKWINKINECKMLQIPLENLDILSRYIGAIPPHLHCSTPNSPEEENHFF